MFNKEQQVIVRAYAGGEFAHIQSEDEAANCGDTLFEFLILESSGTEDCDSFDTAKARLSRAMNEIQGCIDALDVAIEASESNSTAPRR